MKRDTLPKVTVGNTGCKPDALAVFNYDSDARSWMAYCSGQFFSCSDAGRRTARCSPTTSGLVTPDLERRAALLLELPRERRRPFIDRDITRGSYDRYLKRLAIMAALDDEQFHEVDDRLAHLYTDLSPETTKALAACGPPALLDVRVDMASGRTLIGKYDFFYEEGRDCFKEALEDVEVHAGDSAADSVLVYTGHPSERVLAAADELAAPSDTVAASEGDAPVEPSAEEAAPEPAEGPSEPEPGVAPDADEDADADPAARIRAHLDAHREDVLACADAERVVVHVRYTSDGATTVSLRGDAAGTPLEGCVQAALGDIPVGTPAEGGTVVHLVR